MAALRVRPDMLSALFTFTVGSGTIVETKGKPMTPMVSFILMCMLSIGGETDICILEKRVDGLSENQKSKKVMPRSGFYLAAVEATKKVLRLALAKDFNVEAFKHFLRTEIFKLNMIGNEVKVEMGKTERRFVAKD